MASSFNILQPGWARCCYLTAITALSALCVTSPVTARSDILPDHALSPSGNLSLGTTTVEDSLLPALARRDDYTCGPGKPCKNQACCGKSGNCGYGPTYCGTGCTSNCNAHAECGQYSQPAGKKCPLNVCCSQYGFCGTTSEFCGTKCQSNCVLHPQPPGSGSSISMLQNRVIGYYEAWSDRKACHKVGPTQLALDALTHINFAFGYISPGSYQIVPMDAATPESLFREVPNLKSIKPDLKVAMSLGGWTFSDNGTATQPLFGEIAADPAKRRVFADNALRFMRQYGYDGLDIDWEYPGAGDRGGNPADTQNFVQLMRVLRETFDASGSRLELTFTAPSSYWYLRHFDLPGLIKYVDWVNLMSYDLHGVWDGTNPIGKVVLGHTNLTEIKASAELLWRVGVPPSKVVLGVGFYGRSYTLLDPSCAKPGCAFSGASIPGPCTGEGGILGHYEIQAALQAGGSKRAAAVQPVHDTAAAVKYFKFGGDQWISYDDKETFSQKVQWADSVGLAGALIWASDLDDDAYSAHAGLLGRDIQKTDFNDGTKPNARVASDSFAGSNGQLCFKAESRCVDVGDSRALAIACGKGNAPIGWDREDCSKGRGTAICCPADSAPAWCSWRGKRNGGWLSGDCSAQCRDGEINVRGFRSRWGGGFNIDGGGKCSRGTKSFCCPLGDFAKVTQGCSWQRCLGGCKKGTVPKLRRADGCVFGDSYYCCPKENPLQHCRWTLGSGIRACANAVCSPGEVEVGRARYPTGVDGFNFRDPFCDFGRKAAACCTIDRPEFDPLMCGTSGNTATFPGSAGVLVKRDGTRKRPTSITLHEGTRFVIVVLKWALYPYISQLFSKDVIKERVLHKCYRYDFNGACRSDSTQLSIGDVPDTVDDVAQIDPDHPAVEYESEHIIDVAIFVRFVAAAHRGTLREGQEHAPEGLANIDIDAWERWDDPSELLGRQPAVGGSGSRGFRPDTPNGRVVNALGSNQFPDPIMAMDSRLNNAKGKLMFLKEPKDRNIIEDKAKLAVAERAPSTRDLDNLFNETLTIFALFEYFNRPEVAARLNQVRREVSTQLGHIEHVYYEFLGIQEWWDLWLPDYLSQVEEYAQGWARSVITNAIQRFTRATTMRGAQDDAVQYQRNLDIIERLTALLNRVSELTFPADDSMQNPSVGWGGPNPGTGPGAGPAGPGTGGGGSTADSLSEVGQGAGDEETVGLDALSLDVT